MRRRKARYSRPWAGCRLIDTAASYGNEEAVGRAIAASGIPREELFVATKLGTSRQGFQSAQESCKESLDRLGLDYLDLYLIHWPAPKLGKYVESFEGMKVARDEGHVRSIGVCNFTEELLANVIEETDEVPAVNQVELHPRLNQAELRQAHAQHDVTTQSYSPLGVGKMLEDPTVTAIAAEYGRTPAQVLVRWNLQLDNVVVSRSSKPRARRPEPGRVRLHLGASAHGGHRRIARRHPGAARSDDLHGDLVHAALTKTNCRTWSGNSFLPS